MSSGGICSVFLLILKTWSSLLIPVSVGPSTGNEELRAGPWKGPPSASPSPRWPPTRPPRCLRSGWRHRTVAEPCRLVQVPLVTELGSSVSCSPRKTRTFLKRAVPPSKRVTTQRPGDSVWHIRNV